MKLSLRKPWPACVAGTLALALLFLQAGAVAAEDSVEIGVKSLAGPPSEFADHRLPSADELLVSTNFLQVDRDADAAAGTVYTSFSANAGYGFSVVQVTTQYPYFGPATFNGPNGVTYSYDGSTLRCNGGPCGSSEASVTTEAFTNSAGGVMVLSVSGGEVTTSGTWQLAEQPPSGGPLPLTKSAQLDSVVAHDENYVEVGIEPSPCLAVTSSRKTVLCPEEDGPDGPFDQPLTLVEGASPVLTISARGRADGLLGDSDLVVEKPLDLTTMRMTLRETRSQRVVEERTYGLGQLAALERTAQGRTLVELPALPVGEYSVRFDVEGILEGVGPIERTAYYFLPVLPRSHHLTGAVESRALDAERIELRLGVDHLVPEVDTHLFAYAEVWTDDGTPVVWIGGMTELVEHADGETVLPMVLDGRWLALAGVKRPSLVLRNVRIQDPDTFVPLDQLDEVPVTLDGLPKAAFFKLDPSVLESDETLRVGRGDRTIRVPADPDPLPVFKNTDTTGILLVHGWCSGQAWLEGHFPGAGLVGGTDTFVDFGQSRSHDNFAQRIRTQGDACFTDSFSVVAHSQGGAASTHLLAHYTSGLDRSTAPRPIQSMGTPYGGSTLMNLYLSGGPLGYLIAEIFGFCGPQFDLGTLGSALWRGGIPSSARSDVFYYRTRHRRPGSFWERLQFWRWKCNAASYIILGSDDGVVSTSQGSFSNARNMGITDGECHTGGMRYADQRLNVGRNAIMNEEGRPDPPPPINAICQVQATYHPCCDQNGNGYFTYRVDASSSTGDVTEYRWRNGSGSWGPWTTMSSYGPLSPGLPGQASNYTIHVQVRNALGETDGATCNVP